MSLERQPKQPPGRGEPLQGRLRGQAEAATGQSLEHVRVHEDVVARSWVDAVGGLGASFGSHVALGTGAGQGLTREAVLAHELAHAVGYDDEAGADQAAADILLGSRAERPTHSGVLELRHCNGDTPPKVKEAANKTDPAKLTGFEKMVKGGVPAAEAADKMQLPKELREAMEEAWKNSFPGGKSKEQGGVLYRNSDGTLGWVKATESTSGSTTIPYTKIPSGATALVGGHTHPYDASEGGHKGVMFSGPDVANLVTDPVSVKTIHAGDSYFVIAKTKEFEALVEKAPDKAKLKTEIETERKKVFDATPGELPAKARAATKAMCLKYKLILYEGDLTGEVRKVDVSK